MENIVLFVVRLLAGTGMFLVGVALLTDNIEQLATKRIKNLFGKTANKRLTNVGIGAFTTALIQSSGVTTVLIVGFVNVGAMSLGQAAAMIMGANIGTTITAQIAALSAFPIMTYVQILTFVGIMIAMLCKKDSVKKVGYMLAGLGLIFIGLDVMSDVMSANRAVIQSVFEQVSNPFLLLLAGAVFTALVQSSSATTSVLIAMAVAGVSIGTGGNEMLYVVLGTNIGSCVTALLSTIGANANAKRAGVIHLLFNCFGSVLFFVLLTCWPTFRQDVLARYFSEPSVQIAMFHTFFNVTCTILFLPLVDWFVRISSVLVREKPKEAATFYFDERMLLSPMIAISQLTKETCNLADLAFDSFLTAYHAFEEGDLSATESVRQKVEETIDYSQRIVNYLIRISTECKSVAEEKCVTNLHNAVGDLLRIAEIADNITKYTRKENERHLKLSDTVQKQLNDMVDVLSRLFSLAREGLLTPPGQPTEAAALEDEIDAMRKRYVEEHIARLNRGECKPENSDVYINLVSNLERLGDHLSYIADRAKEA